MIKIANQFVCIRTATYEDTQEALFLKKIVFNHSKDLRNFGFCILAPNGKTVLRTSNRGPNYAYPDANKMATDLATIAKKYSQTQKSIHDSVPKMKNAKLPVNVASCDGLPCVLLYETSSTKIREMEEKLSSICWDQKIVGRFIYASTSKKKTIEGLLGEKVKPGFLVVNPDKFGKQGDLIETIPLDSEPKHLLNRLISIAASFKRLEKNHRSHVRTGNRNGVSWKTKVPVPDRQRARR